VMIERIPHNSFHDSRGSLYPFSWSQFPVNFKRLFVTSNLTKGVERGAHAHRVQYQALFAIQGSFRIDYISALESGSITLSSKSDGILIPNLYWSTQTPLENCSVLLVFASGDFDESEYIRDFSEFLELTNDGF